jgi:hypothetical protein
MELVEHDDHHHDHDRGAHHACRRRHRKSINPTGGNLFTPPVYAPPAPTQPPAFTATTRSKAVADVSPKGVRVRPSIGWRQSKIRLIHEFTSFRSARRCAAVPRSSR